MKTLVSLYLIDWWTLAHVLAFAIGAAVLRIKERRWSVVGVMFFALVVGIEWEILEGWIVEPSLGFREPWLNRWVFDIGADVLGAWVGSRIAARRV